MSLATLLLIVFALLLGVLLGWLLSMARQRASRAQLEQALASLQAQQATEAQHTAQLLNSFKDQLSGRENELHQLRQQAQEAAQQAARYRTLAEQLPQREQTIQSLEEQRQQIQRDLAAQQVENSRLKTALEAERNNAQEKLQTLLGAKEELANQFKTLAQSIFEEKSKAFTEQNQTSLGQILTPIREKFTEFEKKVTELREQGLTQSTELRGQLESLKQMNSQLSQNADNLVTALKGSAKTQGDWGEMILQQLLDAAGFIEGQHYRVQQSFKREAESTKREARPDVILSLPEGKHLILDSKVSLIAYSDYSAANDEPTRAAALKRHLAAIQNHISELAGRNYHTLYGLNSIDFVVMFMPLEPAYMLALANDSNLWQQAWKQNVLLVGPSTLLFVLRTVAQLWRQDLQTKNMQKIAERGGLLYDKLVAFTEDLLKVGDNLNKAHASYEEAYKKLAHGRDNAIRQAEKLRKLGLSPKKRLARPLLDRAMDETEVEALSAPENDAQNLAAPTTLALAAEAETDEEDAN